MCALIVPALLVRPGGRVVAVSSLGHRRDDVDVADLKFLATPYEKWSAYGRSKLANILFARELARRGAAAGVVAASLHPGGIMTNLQRTLPRDEMEAMGWIAPDGTLHAAFKSPAQGAATSMYCLLAPEVAQQHSGKYFDDCAVATPLRPQATDDDAAAALWKASEAAVGTEFAF